VSPEVCNRPFSLCTAHHYLFCRAAARIRVRELPRALLIGRSRHGIPRLMPFSFWMSSLGGIVLYFSFLGSNGLYGAEAPPTSAGSFAPLTRRLFGGHTALTIDPFRCCRPASAVSERRLHYRHDRVHALSRMTLWKMPFAVFLNLVMQARIHCGEPPLRIPDHVC